MSRALRPALVCLALAALTAAGFFAFTPMGVAADTQCGQFAVRLVDPNSICSDAVGARAVWVIGALVLAVAAAVAAVFVGRGQGRPRASALWLAGLLVCLALTAAGSLRLGFGSDDYCGSAITGAGRYPYSADKPAQCADAYAHDRALGWTELGGAVLVVVAAAVVSGRRNRESVAAPSATG